MPQACVEVRVLLLDIVRERLRAAFGQLQVVGHRAFRRSIARHVDARDGQVLVLLHRVYRSLNFGQHVRIVLEFRVGRVAVLAVLQSCATHLVAAFHRLGGRLAEGGHIIRDEARQHQRVDGRRLAALVTFGAACHGLAHLQTAVVHPFLKRGRRLVVYALRLAVLPAYRGVYVCVSGIARQGFFALQGAVAYLAVHDDGRECLFLRAVLRDEHRNEFRRVLLFHPHPAQVEVHAHDHLVALTLNVLPAHRDVLHVTRLGRCAQRAGQQACKQYLSFHTLRPPYLMM